MSRRKVEQCHYGDAPSRITKLCNSISDLQWVILGMVAPKEK